MLKVLKEYTDKKVEHESELMEVSTDINLKEVAHAFSGYVAKKP